MAFLDGPAPYAFAHRGFAPGGDENSLAAFQRAVDLGYTYLETDVRVTADGVALAFHDATLDRLTQLRGRIEELPWATVRTARVAGREPIPLLADVLTAWPHTRINLDVKSERSVAAVVDVLRRTRSADRVCIVAFATRRISAVRRALGEGLCTAFGPGAIASLRLYGRARHRGAGCIQAPVRIGGRRIVDSRFVRAAHGLGLPVIAYTVDDPAEMRALLDLGVDGLMTDRADVLRDVLHERGQWP
ncbi:MAG TPA: glycerophosphodiester phosphodiesterase family protein [Jatrophihabitans sp.]|jgi:glycerophosphoryl diester phosphodiesterase